MQIYLGKTQWFNNIFGAYYVLGIMETSGDIETIKGGSSPLVHSLVRETDRKPKWSRHVTDMW